MSTVLIYGLLISLAFVAGCCFGYGITAMMDNFYKDKTHP